MKIIFALCFTALGLTVYGQTKNALFTKDTWREYIAINKKIVQLEARVKSISLDTVEKKGLTRLLGQAQKISSDEAHAAERAADKNLASKTEPLQREITRLRNKQHELEMRYAMPAELRSPPNPATQPKP